MRVVKKSASYSTVPPAGDAELISFSSAVLSEAHVKDTEGGGPGRRILYVRLQRVHPQVVSGRVTGEKLIPPSVLTLHGRSAVLDATRSAARRLCCARKRGEMGGYWISSPKSLIVGVSDKLYNSAWWHYL